VKGHRKVTTGNLTQMVQRQNTVATDHHQYVKKTALLAITLTSCCKLKMLLFLLCWRSWW